MDTSLPARIFHPSATGSALLFFAEDCSTAGDPFGCRLNSFLHVLYIAAALLGVALLIVAVLAYRTYRQNKIDAAAGTKAEKTIHEKKEL